MIPFSFEKPQPLKSKKNFRAPIIFHNFNFEDVFLHVNLKFFSSVDTETVFNINLHSQFNKDTEFLRNIYIAYAANNSFLKTKINNTNSCLVDLFPINKYEREILRTRFDKYDDVVKDIFFDDHCLTQYLKMF